MGSIEHIRATPGFAGRSWPHEMSLQDNLCDLDRHAQDFADRRGFAYTVLSTESDQVIASGQYVARCDSHVRRRPA